MVFIKLFGDYVKFCKILRLQWVNLCFIFIKFMENCIYMFLFEIVNMKIEIEIGS